MAWRNITGLAFSADTPPAHTIFAYPLWQQCTAVSSAECGQLTHSILSAIGIHLIMQALAGKDLLQQSHMQLKILLEAQKAT